MCVVSYMQQVCWSQPKVMVNFTISYWKYIRSGKSLNDSGFRLSIGIIVGKTINCINTLFLAQELGMLEQKYLAPHLVEAYGKK